ncbi:MAG: AAA family ATPase [Nitrospirae bacterium]|nr:AAA family ATPase [Nitrospirota bacterium]
MSNYSIFKHGSAWVRADFHLHTCKDSEFSYQDDEKDFVKSYIEALKKADIRVGAITNHNKFDSGEFKALRKNALKEDIFLLPGIELSVKDGKSGVHTIVIFNDDWISNTENKDYINDFLRVTFAGRSNYENENARSNHYLLETIRELDKFGRDYFLLFAHVETENGLWGSLSGGRIQELAKDEQFKKKTLGFQKVMTHDVHDRVCRIKVQNWLINWYPAEIEGSDCKSIDEVGRGKKTFLKLGDYVFSAIKYALIDFENRVAPEAVQYKHSHIKSITFAGGVLDGHEIDFSPELNSLIGIRGSGKSSILEALRYALDIPFGDKVVDSNYKSRLVEHTLGSGGKIVLQAIDRRGQEYEIRRILNEQPDVYVGGILQPGVSIRETILYKPIYFGQKDLSSSGEGFEKDLVEKLVGENLTAIRNRIEMQRQKVADTVIRLKKLTNVEESKKEYDSKKRDAEFKLNLYKQHGVEEKLQKQIDFDVDSRKCVQVLSSAKEYLDDLEQLIGRHEDDLANHLLYKSKRNESFFVNFFEIYKKITDSFGLLKKALDAGRLGFNELTIKEKDFDKEKKGLKEEFAEIERRLSEELTERGAQAIRPDEFLQLKKTVDQAGQMLKALEKQQSQQMGIHGELLLELTKLNDLWHDEFVAIQNELQKVNENHSSLQIFVGFKEDKKAFVEYMKNLFRGSKIRENTFTSITAGFSDFGAMFKDFEKAKNICGNSAHTFEEYFKENMTPLLTWQVPNRFTIKYRDKELKHHSLGQRASALILFVLSQRENDLILIDQPEDDLDNQTIYEDVIKLIRGLKRNTQFIFATHNANIPVLGDSERIFACNYADDHMSISYGNIDCSETQQKIVDIMEGGKEAFNRRKEIYQIWKLQNSSK